MCIAVVVCVLLHSLSAPNFMVSTSLGKVLAVQADSFIAPDPDNPSGAHVLVDAPDSCLTHILAHPLRPELLLLATPGCDAAASSSSSSSSKGAGPGPTSANTSSSGPGPGSTQQQQQGRSVVQVQRLLRWDLVSRACITSRQLPPEQAAVQVALARDGAFAVLGCAAGSVVVLNGETLQEIVSLRHTKHEICRWAVLWLGHTGVDNGRGSQNGPCVRVEPCMVACRALLSVMLLNHLLVLL